MEKAHTHPQSSGKPLPVCQKCRSYQVTWDAERPHACTFFAFKSYHLPAVEVQKSTGLVCPQFRLSKGHAKIDAQARPGAGHFGSQLAAERPAGALQPVYSAAGEFVGTVGKAKSQELQELQGVQEMPEDKATAAEGPRKNEDPRKELGQILGEGILL